jgi:transcriptional regulator with XRE-family HTH domain
MSYHDLTLRDIAAATQCAVSTVGTWKNGRIPSSRRTLQQLAEIFRVSMEYLLEGRAMLPPSQPDCPAVAEAAERVLEDLDVLLNALENHRREAVAPAVKERSKCGRTPY